MQMENYKHKQLFVFDLDGTLAPSKMPIKEGMVKALEKFLSKRKVAVIGGGSIEVFKKQFQEMMKDGDANLSNLFLFPTSGAQFYRFEGGWKKIYSHDLGREEKTKIISALERAIKESGVQFPQETFGEVIEDRGSQISLSPFGQEAPLEKKKDWDKDGEKRQKIKSFLSPLLPEFEIRIGGTTTVDITKKGIDKAYGIREMSKGLHIAVEDMVFFGDAIFPGGNDFSASATGIDMVKVKDEEDTMEIIESILSNLD